MAKQCPNCQQLLDENARFCPICGAPVSDVKSLDAPIQVSEGQLPPPLIPDPPGQAQSPTGFPDQLSPLTPPTAGLTRPALLAGIIMGVTSALPYLNCCCWLWVVGAGVLAVYLLRLETTAEISASMGAKLGFLTGILGAIFWQILDLPISYISGPERVQQLQELFKSVKDLPPESAQVLDWIVDLLHNPFNPFLLLIGILSKLCIGGVFTTVGGLLGVAFFGKPKSS